MYQFLFDQMEQEKQEYHWGIIGQPTRLHSKHNNINKQSEERLRK